MFAYRTHAHSLGSVISGYRYVELTCAIVSVEIDVKRSQICNYWFYHRYSVGDEGELEWKMIAKGNPNWPQVESEASRSNSCENYRLSIR